MDKEAKMLDWVTSNLMAIRRDDGTMEYTLPQLLRAMAAYGDLRARQERERCAKVAEDWGVKGVEKWADDQEMQDDAKARAWDATVIASAIRSLKDEPETGHG